MEAKRKLREFRLLAKTKSKAALIKLMAGMANVVDQVQKELGPALAAAASRRLRLARYRKVPWEKAQRLHETMTKLLPKSGTGSRPASSPRTSS